MKLEMKGGLPAGEMGDEVLGSIPGAGPLGANVGLPCPLNGRKRKYLEKEKRKKNKKKAL